MNEVTKTEQKMVNKFKRNKVFQNYKQANKLIQLHNIYLVLELIFKDSNGLAKKVHEVLFDKPHKPCSVGNTVRKVSKF